MELSHAVTVPVAPERAFSAFTEGISAWWPREYTWAADALDTIAIEPGTGGRCFERGPNGFQCDWGRVLEWKPPSRLSFSWQIGPDRVPVPDAARASEVDVRFEPTGAQATSIELVHRGFERHGESGAGYREALASEQGWPWILNRFAASLG